MKNFLNNVALTISQIVHNKKNIFKIFINQILNVYLNINKNITKVVKKVANLVAIKKIQIIIIDANVILNNLQNNLYKKQIQILTNYLKNYNNHSKIKFICYTKMVKFIMKK